MVRLLPELRFIVFLRVFQRCSNCCLKAKSFVGIGCRWLIVIYIM